MSEQVRQGQEYLRDREKNALILGHDLEGRNVAILKPRRGSVKVVRVCQSVGTDRAKVRQPEVCVVHLGNVATRRAVNGNTESHSELQRRFKRSLQQYDTLNDGNNNSICLVDIFQDNRGKPIQQCYQSAFHWIMVTTGDMQSSSQIITISTPTRPTFYRPDALPDAHSTVS